MNSSIKKAVDILRVLSDEPERPIPLRDIAEKLDMNKSTCVHILEALCETHMAERISRSEGYVLGPDAYLITRYGRYKETLTSVSEPIIKWLRAQLDTTVFLAVSSDGIKYILVHEDGTERLDYTNSDIIRGRIEDTATGMLMMAFMDTDSLERVSRNSAFGNMDGVYLKMREKYFQSARNNGYVYMANTFDNRCSFAFRIYDGEKTLGAIGVTYAEGEDSAEKRAEIIKKGQIAVKEINRRLKFENKP